MPESPEFSDVKAVMTAVVPQSPLFDDFLDSLRGAGLSVEVEGHNLTVEITTQRIESVRGLVKALLGEEAPIQVSVDEEAQRMMMPIEELGLRSKTVEALKDQGFETVRDLCIGRCDYLTHYSEREVRIALHRIGIEANVHSVFWANVLCPTIPERTDMESSKKIRGWFSMVYFNNVLAHDVRGKTVAEVQAILEPLIEKCPQYIGYFDFGDNSVMRLHPKLANRIIVTCSTREELLEFVQNPPAL